MMLGRVLGPVVATIKHPHFDGLKLLVVQPVDEALNASGKSIIAVDRITSAGKGDLVLVNREGGGNRQILKNPQGCIRSVIVGVVDQVDVA